MAATITVHPLSVSNQAEDETNSDASERVLTCDKRGGTENHAYGSAEVDHRRSPAGGMPLNPLPHEMTMTTDSTQKVGLGGGVT